MSKINVLYDSFIKFQLNKCSGPKLKKILISFMVGYVYDWRESVMRIFMFDKKKEVNAFRKDEVKHSRGNSILIVFISAPLSNLFAQFRNQD